jgi:tetratricopeptide (TPR) repeat protein
LNNYDEAGSIDATNNNRLTPIAKIDLFSWPQLIIIFVLFVGAVMVCHWAGMHALTVYDGAYFINSNTNVFANHNLIGVMSIVPVRPLFCLSLYFNYVLTGMDPFYFRVFNAVILAASGLALCLLIMIILETPALQIEASKSLKQGISVFMGLLFVIHPLQSFVVLYVWQREAIMACFFIFLGLATYLATRTGRITNQTTGYLLTAALFLAGMLSKENVATLPLLMFLVELTLLRQGLRDLIYRLKTICIIILPCAIIYLVITYQLHTGHSETEYGILKRLTVYYQSSGLTIPQVLMTQSRIFWSYIGMMLFPSTSTVEFMRAEIISATLLDPPQTLAAVIGILAIVVAAIGLARRNPMVSFGIAFMLVSLAPESLLIPQYLHFGYRAVLPMGGLLIILASVIQGISVWLLARAPIKVFRMATAVVVLVAVSSLGFSTISRAQKWTHISFWQDLAQRLPVYSQNVQVVPYLDIVVNSISAFLSVKRYSDAIDLFRKFVLKQPEVAQNLSDQTNIQDLITEYVHIFGEQRGRADGALIGLGIALQGTGNNEAAIFSYKKAVDILPYHPDVHMVLGYLLESSGNRKDALMHYRKATEVDPGSVTTYNCYGDALKRSGRMYDAMIEYYKATVVDPKSVDGYINLAAALLESGYHREGIAEYEKALKLNPESADVHHKMGRALVEIGDLEKAINHYRTAVRLDPNQAVTYGDLALALEVQGNLKESIAQFRKAIAADPNSAIINAFFGKALIRLGQLSQAIQVLQRAVLLDQNLYISHHYLGLALELRGNLKPAIESYTKAIKIQPGLAGLHVDLGRALLKTRNLVRAIVELKTAVSLDPKNSQGNFYLALATERTGAFPIAQQYYRSAIQVRPDMWEAHYYLANNLEASKNYSEAVKSYKKAIELHPDFTEAYANLAVALLHLEQIPEAIVTLIKALKPDKQNAQLFYALGLAYARMKDNSRATEFFEKALKIDPDVGKVSENLDQLGRNEIPEKGTTP